MKYKIIVDKQSRENPSDEIKEYEIDIEELHCKGDIYDSLVITKDEDYVMRRLGINEYNVLKVLDEPIKEALEEINIELFEGDNYIYVQDMSGNKFYAEYLVKNEFTDMYVTVNQMNSAINQTAEKIEINVNQKLDKDELGTQLILNKDALKLAWNQISQYLQLEGIEGKASLVIYDKNNKRLTTYDETGQHFYDDNSIFGEMGIKTIDNERYISFSVLGEYGSNIANGMAWGITTKSDNKFFPVLFMKNFHIANENAGDFAGELQLNACDLVLYGIETGIKSMNIKMIGNVFGGISFIDLTSENTLLEISPGISGLPDGIDDRAKYPSISILDNIYFGRNNGESNSFILGENACILTDDGHISANSIYSRDDITADGYVQGKEFLNVSLATNKKNIQKYNNSAINEIKKTDIYTYNYKSDTKGSKKRIGVIIGDNYNTSEEIVATTKQGIDIYSMVSVLWKAVQEQQEQIEELQKEIKQLKEEKDGKD